MEAQGPPPDVQQRLAELFKEIARDSDDLESGRATVQGSRTRRRETAKKLKVLEQELKLLRKGR